MRRKDREMDRGFGLKVIDQSPYGVVSLVDQDGDPYGVPLSIVRVENNLYFHSATVGKKVEAFAKSSKVCVTFVSKARVPDLYSNEELDEILKDKSKVALLGDKVFTTEFESAIVKGKIEEVEEDEEMLEALKHICQKYTPTRMKYFDLSVEKEVKGAKVYRIEIQDIKAKRKKFDSNKEEMKWSREE